MNEPCFTDKNVAPTEAAILVALGRAASTWRTLFEQLRAAHPELTESWNYYADGKRWLLKVTRGSKTMFWVSVVKGAFRVGFYFPERLTAALLASELSDERKLELRRGAPMGKLRSVSIELGPRGGIRDVMTLMDLKKALK